MEGLYIKGGRNTTSEEVDKIEDLLMDIDSISKQTVSDKLFDLINEITNRAYEDGKNDLCNE